MVLGSFPKKSLSWNICSLKSLPIWLGVALVIYTTYMIFNIRKQSSAPLIVAWTMYFRGTISAKVSPTMTNCPYQCDIVERSCDYGTRIPSAYIFHGRDVDVHDLPTRYPHQLMVFMLLEPPPYAGKAWKQFPYAYFNATMTYRNDSDYPLPYGKFVKRSATDETQALLTERQIRKALQRKMRGALLLMSNCYSNSTRESIIRRLSEKIGITVAGRCNSMFPKAKQVYCPKSVNNGKCEDDLVATHRFYIAFENSLCRNYISEKFFRRVSQMMIPIVLNRRFNVDVTAVRRARGAIS
ncbi:Fucosyl transferase [Trichostrongylus colubriformis]|uniref:Fucosyltransferase n=1 Tax=Trichostrongylus colubriformis TaxID=6319 RepID=A0AAN8FFL2_TRICO